MFTDDDERQSHNGSDYALEHVSCPGYVPVDQRGHIATSQVARLDWIKHSTFVRTMERYGETVDVYAHPVDTFALRSVHECTFCGVRPQFYLERDDSKVTADSECTATDGVITTYEVVFPSGRVVVDDDLRDVFEIPIERGGEFYSYNTAIGQRQVVMAYAEHDIAYGPVGNTCPDVYRVAEDKYQIANPAYDDDDEPKDYDGVSLAGVCTDLWAYTLMDYAQYQELGGSEKMGWTRTIIDIKPGRYRFTHHTGERSFDYDQYKETQVYADFEWIADA